jgi:ornithine carbamoyltransferase
MNKHLGFRSLWAMDTLSSEDAERLLALACDLGQADRSGGVPSLLRGVNIALLSDDQTHHSAALFHRAAAELGAQVSRVAATDPISAPADAQERMAHRRQRARLLGRLYGAIECQGMPDHEVRAIADEAGVPVFNQWGGETHPLQSLSKLMTSRELHGEALGHPGLDDHGPGPISPMTQPVTEAHRRHLLQAMLVASLT